MENLAKQSLNPLEVQSIILQASDLAAQKSAEHIDLYFQLFGASITIILFILGFVGYSQIKEIRNSISLSMKREIKDEILTFDTFHLAMRSAIEEGYLASSTKQIQKLERLIDVGRMASLAEKIDESSSFSDKDKIALMQSLINLKDDESVTESPEYSTSLRLAVRSLSAAGLKDDMDQMFDNFLQFAQKDVQIAVPMLEHFALRCLSESGFTEEEKDNASVKMLTLASYVEKLRFPEISNQYLLTYELWKNGKGRVSDRIVQSILMLTAHEINVFRSALSKALDPRNISTSDRVTPDIICFSEKFQQTVAAYPELLEQA